MAKYDPEYLRELFRQSAEIKSVLDTINPEYYAKDNTAWGNFTTGVKTGLAGTVEGLGGFASLIGMDSIGQPITKSMQDYQNSFRPSGYDYSQVDSPLGFLTDSEWYTSGEAARGLGQGVGSLASFLVPQLAGAKVVSAIGNTAKGTGLIANTLKNPYAQKIIGSAAPTTMESATEAGFVFNETGNSKAAWKDFGANMALLGVSNAGEVALAYAKGGEKVFGSLAKKYPKTSNVAEFAGKVAGTSAMEGYQEIMQERFQHNVGEGQNPLLDSSWSPVPQTVEEGVSGVIGAMMGGGMGGIGHMASKYRRKTDPNDDITDKTKKDDAYPPNHGGKNINAAPLQLPHSSIYGDNFVMQNSHVNQNALDLQTQFENDFKSGRISPQEYQTILNAGAQLYQPVAQYGNITVEQPVSQGQIQTPGSQSASVNDFLINSAIDINNKVGRAIVPESLLSKAQEGHPVALRALPKVVSEANDYIKRTQEANNGFFGNQLDTINMVAKSIDLALRDKSKKTSNPALYTPEKIAKALAGAPSFNGASQETVQQASRETLSRSKMLKKYNPNQQNLFGDNNTRFSESVDNGKINYQPVSDENISRHYRPQEKIFGHDMYVRKSHDKDLDIISRIAKTLKSKSQVKFFKSQSLSEKNIHGFYNPNDNNIYLNEDTSKPHLWLLGHEFSHELKHKDNKTYNEIKDALLDVLGNDKINDIVREYEKNLRLDKNRQSPSGKRYDTDTIIDEIVSDLFGDRIHSQDFAKHLSNKKGLVQKVYDYLKEFIAKISNRLNYKNFSDKHIENIKQELQHVIDTFLLDRINPDQKNSPAKNNDYWDNGLDTTIIKDEKGNPTKVPYDPNTPDQRVVIKNEYAGGVDIERLNRSKHQSNSLNYFDESFDTGEKLPYPLETITGEESFKAKRTLFTPGKKERELFDELSEKRAKGIDTTSLEQELIEGYVQDAIDIAHRLVPDKSLWQFAEPDALGALVKLVRGAGSIRYGKGGQRVDSKYTLKDDTFSSVKVDDKTIAVDNSKLDAADFRGDIIPFDFAQYHDFKGSKSSFYDGRFKAFRTALKNAIVSEFEYLRGEYDGEGQTEGRFHRRISEYNEASIHAMSKYGKEIDKISNKELAQELAVFRTKRKIANKVTKELQEKAKNNPKFEYPSQEKIQKLIENRLAKAGEEIKKNYPYALDDVEFIRNVREKSTSLSAFKDSENLKTSDDESLSESDFQSKTLFSNEIKPDAYKIVTTEKGNETSKKIDKTLSPKKISGELSKLPSSALFNMLKMFPEEVKILAAKYAPFSVDTVKAYNNLLSRISKDSGENPGATALAIDMIKLHHPKVMPKAGRGDAKANTLLKNLLDYYRNLFDGIEAQLKYEGVATEIQKRNELLSKKDTPNIDTVKKELQKIDEYLAEKLGMSFEEFQSNEKTALEYLKDNVNKNYSTDSSYKKSQEVSSENYPYVVNVDGQDHFFNVRSTARDFYKTNKKQNRQVVARLNENYRGTQSVKVAPIEKANYTYGDDYFPNDLKPSREHPSTIATDPNNPDVRLKSVNSNPKPNPIKNWQDTTEGKKFSKDLWNSYESALGTKQERENLAKKLSSLGIDFNEGSAIDVNPGIKTKLANMIKDKLLANREVSKKDMLGLAQKYLRSPSKLAEIFPQFGKIYKLAKGSFELEQRLKTKFFEKLNPIFDSLTTDEQKNALNNAVLAANYMGRDLTDKEIKVFKGADNKVIKAYRDLRGHLDMIHRNLNRINALTGRNPVNYVKGYFPHIWDNWQVSYKDAAGNIVKQSYLTHADALEAWKEARKLDEKATVSFSVPQFQSTPNYNHVERGELSSHEQQEMMQEFTLDASDLDALSPDIENILKRRDYLPTQHRFFANLMQRKGMEGYSKDVRRVISRYTNRAARYMALEPFKTKAVDSFGESFGDFEKDHANNPLAAYTKQYILDINGNPSNIEEYLNRLIGQIPYLADFLRKHTSYGNRFAVGLANGITEVNAITTLGFFNVATALVQLSQVMNIYGLVGRSHTYDAMKRLADLSKEDKWVLKSSGILYDANIANASGYAKGAGQLSYNNKIQTLARKSMWLFNEGDLAARKVAVLAGYHKAIKEGKSKKESLEYAKEVNRRTNYDYSVVDASGAFRNLSVVGQVALQFKKFTLKQGEFAYDLLFDKNSTSQERVRFFGAMFAMAGLMGLPFGDMLDEILKALTGKDIGGNARNYLIQNSGNGLQKALTHQAIYGAGSHIGVDLSKRLGIYDSVPDNYAPGVTRPIKAMQSAFKHGMASPEFLGNVVPAIGNLATGLQGHPKGMKDLHYTTGERLARALGFIPLRESIERDKRIFAMKKQQEKKNDSKTREGR